MMRRLLFIVLVLLPGAQTSLGQSLGWAALKQAVRLAYPDVYHLSPDSLAAWITSDAPAPLLLDVRTEAEFAVSHLRDAQRIAPETDDLTALLALPRDTPIVAYCAVGYRSSAMARRLTEAGFTNVANLEGFIFAWANAGYRVYRDGRVVQQVHPYDKIWGLLLDEKLRAYTPSPEH